MASHMPQRSTVSYIISNPAVNWNHYSYITVTYSVPLQPGPDVSLLSFPVGEMRTNK